ncbi:rRNA_methylase domain-containing protein [Cephalotus follicularis]|uniref:rRNA_methylase domain-containing protein n=1 Tax=Cephalotus follicularis TaxID=3775 RepID=A0A1Q3BZQ2_CEPFO|nr:rRNA_methylase domain-containing protein [Cephalotus follicularis]
MIRIRSHSFTINRSLAVLTCFNERLKLCQRNVELSLSRPMNLTCYAHSINDGHKNKAFPLPELKDEVVGYIFGEKKATEVAHLVWKHVVREGDTVVDATCGNGYDTLAMLKLVADDSGRGRVYGMDIQADAIKNTSSFLGETLNPKEQELVKLFHICHSRMEDIVPLFAPVRLVSFNLGYLPGGDRSIITKSDTTLLALLSAKRILIPGGLISLVVYVGHPGGREELETVEAFASELTVYNWVCCKFQMLNRPLAPVLVFMFKR